MRPIARTMLAATGAGVLALAVAGCGEDSESSSDAAARPAGATALRGAPIKIGTICSCSGPQGAGLVGVKTISEAWVKWVNTHGGINGHPVELVFLDDGGDATKAATLARQLVQQDKVKAIVGNYSLQGSALAGIAKKAGVPVIGGPGQAPEEFTDANVFPTGSGSIASIYNNVAAAKDAGTSKLAVFYCAEAPICAQFPALVGGFSKLVGGMAVAASVKVSAAAPSYAAPCLAAKNSGADAAIIAASSAVTVRIIKQCVQQGFKALQLGGAGSVGHNDADSLGGSKVLLVTPGLGVEDTSTAGGKLLQEVIAAYAPDLPESPGYTQDIATPFAGLQLFAKVGEEAKLTPTSKPADVVAGLYDLNEETLGGLTGPLTYTKGKPTFAPCSFITKYDGQEWAANPKPACLPPTTVKSILASMQ